MGTIRPIRENDAPAYARIYNHYIRSTTVTFEETEISNQEALQRIQQTTLAGYPWLVFEESDKQLSGYAYAGLFKERASYRQTLELSIYLDANATGRGIGSKLMQAILDAVSKLDCHILIGGVALPNPASARLHEKFGFEKIAHFKEVGRKFDQWIDVAYWQKTIL